MSFKSKLKDHKYKKGMIYTPMNYKLSSSIVLNSWLNERLPEYIWLALIHNYYGRKKAFSIIYSIFQEFKSNNIELINPKLSTLLAKRNTEKETIFSIITKYVQKLTLNPLTLIYRAPDYPVFNKYFYDKEIFIEEKISRLEEIFKIYSDHQSNEATDIRYLIVCNSLLNEKVLFSNDLKISPEAVMNYPDLNHDDEMMKIYRPFIRTMEGFEFEPFNFEFVNNFRLEVFSVSRCKPMILKYDKSEDKSKMLDDIKLSLEFILAKERKNHAFDVKFEVFLGSVYYSLKIMHEIMTKDIESAILGRLGIRTLVEVYVMMKYLVIKESENPKIWNQYKQYGIGKYKLVLKKQQDKTRNITHLNEKLLEIFVNEDKSEEFVDIDVTYFDKLSIREKFNLVDESELYEICYEYDTNYTHGLWGAVRESSMTFCDNALHFNHTIPDTDLEIQLPSVIEDCKLVFFKLLLLFSKNYTLPDWFVKKYEDYLNGKS